MAESMNYRDILSGMTASITKDKWDVILQIWNASGNRVAYKKFSWHHGGQELAYAEAGIALGQYSYDSPSCWVRALWKAYPLNNGMTRAEIDADAKALGFKFMYWGSDEAVGLKGFYNGDTLVAYSDPEDLPDDYAADAEKYGKRI